jgi:hypothetical protein
MINTRRAVCAAVAVGGVLSALVLFTAQRAGATPTTYPRQTTCVWHMPKDTPAGQFGWPQTFVGCDIPTPDACGENFQRDHYVVENATEEAKLTQLEQSGLTHASEDGSLLDHGGSWDAPIFNAACETESPTPTPTPTVTSPTPTPTPTTDTPTPTPTPTTSSPGGTPSTSVSSHSPSPSSSTSKVVVTDSSSVGPPLSTSRTSPAAHVSRLAHTGVSTGQTLMAGLGVLALGALLVLLGSRGWGRRSH